MPKSDFEVTQRMHSAYLEAQRRVGTATEEADYATGALRSPHFAELWDDTTPRGALFVPRQWHLEQQFLPQEEALVRIEFGSHALAPPGPAIALLRAKARATRETLREMGLGQLKG